MIDQNEQRSIYIIKYKIGFNNRCDKLKTFIDNFLRLRDFL